MGSQTGGCQLGASFMGEANMQDKQKQAWAPIARRMPAYGWALAAALWLSACQPGGAPSPAASSSAASQAQASAPDAAASGDEASAAALPGVPGMPASSAPQAAARVRGIYVWGSEVETLSPCNTDKTYWLEGEEALLAPLQELALQKADAANEAYQPIYVDVLAAHAGRATEGLAVDYDGVLQLQAVHTASGQVPADCKLLDGTDPAASATPTASTAR